MEKNYVYLAYFDCLGFEYIVNLTTLERKHLLSAIKNEQPDSLIHLNAMVLRAKFNNHRSPEIWSFVSEVDEKTLREISIENPQILADLIRKNGKAIYRTNAPKAKIV
jgi:hypothetical protein